MIVSYSELEHVLNPRIKSRTVHLPFVYGKWGERRPCSAKRGGVYRLRAVAPEERLEPVYERLLPQAEAFPCQRAGVLWLMKECVLPDLSCVVTVREVPQPDEGSWLVRFTKGDQRDMFDRPRLPAKTTGGPHGDYVSSPALALDGTDDEVPAALLAEYAERGRETHADFLSDARKRALEAIEEISGYSTTRSDRRRLRAAAFQIRMMERRDDAA